MGENILLDGIEFHMQVRDRLRIGESVLVAITERIEPCDNLCKLPYINDETLAPKDRICIKRPRIYSGSRRPRWVTRVVSQGFGTRHYQGGRRVLCVLKKE